MKKYHYRMDVFEGSVQTVLTKFKRLQGDWLIRKEKFDQESSRNSLLTDAIRFEQMVQSKAISTLVELEFIQQSLDFQDEFDKHSLSLLGLNDLNLTYEDLMSKDKSVIKGQSGRLNDATKSIAVRLSNECMSCGDERMKKKVTSAFKMACIDYAPSPVIFRGKRYERRNLIEAKRTMLDAQWEELVVNNPFKNLFENGGGDQSQQFYREFNERL